MIVLRYRGKKLCVKHKIFQMQKGLRTYLISQNCKPRPSIKHVFYIAFPAWVKYIFLIFWNLEPQVPPGAIHIQPLRGCAV
jgi:hypothetical protein